MSSDIIDQSQPTLNKPRSTLHIHTWREQKQSEVDAPLEHGRAALQKYYKINKEE